MLLSSHMRHEAREKAALSDLYSILYPQSDNPNFIRYGIKMGCLAEIWPERPHFKTVAQEPFEDEECELSLASYDSLAKAGYDGLGSIRIPFDVHRMGLYNFWVRSDAPSTLESLHLLLLSQYPVLRMSTPKGNKVQALFSHERAQIPLNPSLVVLEHQERELQEDEIAAFIKLKEANVPWAA